MKQKLTLVLATLLLAGGLARALAADVLTVAVFDFESKDEAVRDLGPKVSALSGSPRVRCFLGFASLDLHANPYLVQNRNSVTT